MVEGDPTPEKLAQVELGILSKDYVTLSATTLRLPDPEVTPHGPTAWIEIKLREGKKRQMRHMTAAGLPTLRLIRVVIGTTY